MNKRVLRTLINEQGLWEDEMLPTFQTITILVHPRGFALFRAGLGGYLVAGPRRLGSFFQSPYRPDMGKSIRRWPLAGIKAPSLLSGQSAVCPGVRPLCRVSGSSVCRRIQAGLPGSCYVPGGAEALPSSASAGRHLGFGATCRQVCCWTPGSTPVRLQSDPVESVSTLTSK